MLGYTRKHFASAADIIGVVQFNSPDDPKAFTINTTK